MEARFKDKVVLVTGSSSGIGEGTALFFAEHGARVILASRNEKANHLLLDRIKDRGGNGIFIRTDVSKTSEVQNMVTEAVDRFGTINIAVNNAGIEGTPLSKTADYEESVMGRSNSCQPQGCLVMYEIRNSGNAKVWWRGNC